MTDRLADTQPRLLPALVLSAVVAWLAGTSNIVRAQEQLAIVSDNRIDECSGLACSHANGDAVWMHNDSGDKPRLFLVGADGETRTVCDIRNAKAVDWEDMCSFRVDNLPWLLIGDVGDNQAKRSRKKAPCTLYLLNEPTPEELQHPSRRWKVRIRFEYEDGPHNCEGVAVDSVRREILLLTKESPLTTAVYRMPLDITQPKQQLVARQIARLPLAFPTGLDISPDGLSLAAVTMWDGWICRRKNEQSWEDALHHSMVRLEMPQRKQGEAVCFSADGRFLMVNSEHKNQPLWRLDAQASLPASR